MPELDDIDLLREYVDHDSEEAFATLVARHINKVYSVVLRHTGNPHQAEEITQAVFVILAKKARHLGKGVVLSGWLYQTARLTAVTFIRSEIRRARREQEAHMQSTLNESESDAWKHIAPLLDTALARLGQKDRDAIVLRYFDGKSMKEVGTVLGAKEIAAKKRVNRAVEKLRTFFTKRGVVLPVAALTAAISANSVQAAPVGLTISAVAAAKGLAATASILTLVKETIKIMTWLKLKFALGVGVAAILAGGVVTVAISQTSEDDKLTPQEIAKQSLNAYAALSSYSDTGTIESDGFNLKTKTTFRTRLQRPNYYRIDWAEPVGDYVGGGVAWSEGNGDFLATGQVGQEKTYSPEKLRAFQQQVGCTGAACATVAAVPTAFFRTGGRDALGDAASGENQSSRERDQKVSRVDCYVLSTPVASYTLPEKGGVGSPGNKGDFGATRTFWIGKRDHLIHKTRITKIVAGKKRIFTQTHENIIVNQKFSPADFAHNTAPAKQAGAPQLVFVGGEVLAPGRFPWTNGLTLLDSLERAGGYSSFADPTKIEIRSSGSLTQMVSFDVAASAPAKNPKLNSGDAVWLPRNQLPGTVRDPEVRQPNETERFISVVGEVRHAGQLLWTNEMRLSVAIELAGGLTESADPARLQVRHFNGGVDPGNYFEATNSPLKNNILIRGDRIIVLRKETSK